MILSLDVDDHHDAHEKQGSPGFLLPAAELRTAFVAPHHYLEDSGLFRQAPNAKTLREVADLSDFLPIAPTSITSMTPIATQTPVCHKRAGKRSPAGLM
jgi:hypothetical protein